MVKQVAIFSRCRDSLKLGIRQPIVRHDRYIIDVPKDSNLELRLLQDDLKELNYTNVGIVGDLSQAVIHNCPFVNLEYQ